VALRNPTSIELRFLPLPSLPLIAIKIYHLLSSMSSLFCAPGKAVSKKAHIGMIRLILGL